MGDIKTVLDFLDPEQADYLRKRAEERSSTVEDELRRMVAEAMEGEDVNGDPLDNIVGMFSGDGKVTSENFHDYLYGDLEG